MTRSAVEPVVAPAVRRRAAAGPPPGWLLLLALVLTVVVTADLLAGGLLERLDVQISAVTGSWRLRASGGYWLVWMVTQLGGRVVLVGVLAVLVGVLAVRRRTLRPLVRALVAVALLTGVVYGLKYGAGRSAPAGGGSLFHVGGASFPSGHVANATLMWGLARWQAVEYGLPAAVQRSLLVLSVAGPVAAGAAMVALDYHWFTDAVAGGTVGLLLLGVVHVLDATVLSRFVRARAGRPPA